MERILLVANEYSHFDQVGFRRPLGDLKKAGLISNFAVVSPQKDIIEGLNKREVHHSIRQTIRDLHPTIILIMHPHRMGFNSRILESFRLYSDTKIILWEGDAYSLLRKQPSISDIAVARAADVIYTVGAGSLARNFRLYGAHDVRWIPQCFETDRLGRNTPLVREASEYTRDVTIIANKSGHRFRPAPGWRQRADFIESAQARFQQKLSLFGWGWNGIGALGPLDFNDQYRVISESRITANWDHYPNAHSYFSNRLPISLAAGSVHATTWHPGYDKIFPAETRQFLLTSPDRRSLLAQISYFLDSKTDDEMLELSNKASEFAFLNFRQDDWLVKMINFDQQRVNLYSAKESWTLPDVK